MRLVIVGGGFAGVWAAIGASQRLPHDGSRRATEITLVSRDPWLTIRPRLYERTLDAVRVPLDLVLAGTGVTRVQGDVIHVDWSERRVSVASRSGTRTLGYDRLVLAAGSELNRPSIPGMELAFCVDTFAQAEALQSHLQKLRSVSDVHTPEGVVVVGAGFTGLEVATELASRSRSATHHGNRDVFRRVTLVDSGDVVGRHLGESARRHIQRVLKRLDIEVRLGQRVRSIERGGVRLSNGERIRAATTIWTGGFRASALARALPIELDDLGRIPVDEFLRVKGLPSIYAAGDIARVLVDPTHVAPMSCQYAIPMGTLAGTNAVSDMLGLDLAPFSPPPYVTCLDLGDTDALFTEGFGDNQDVRLTGYWAKRMKEAINRQLIYPPVAAPALLAEPEHRPSAA